MNSQLEHGIGVGFKSHLMKPTKIVSQKNGIQPSVKHMDTMSQINW